ncbi:MAG: YihY/virulence factor BrkB family protein [Anaerolineales bacterium]
MDLHNTFEKIQRSLKSLYERLNEMSGGVLEIIRSTIERFSQERGAEAAASLAYYAFFSIFPMLLVIIVVGSFFVDRNVVQTQLLNLLQGVLPGAKDIVIENIERVLELRGTVTFLALVSLTWSATNVFNLIAKNINRAFPSAQIPNFLKGRMLGFFMFLGLGLLMLLSFAASAISGLIPVINIPFNDKALHETFLWQVGAFMVPIFTNILMFWAIYHWIPMVKVSRKASLIGAVIAGIAWELLNNVFTWYLSSGLSTYRLVYGSVGTVVALLFWIYITAIIILMGAHLTASIHKAFQKKSVGAGE